MNEFNLFIFRCKSYFNLRIEIEVYFSTFKSQPLKKRIACCHSYQILIHTISLSLSRIWDPHTLSWFLIGLWSANLFGGQFQQSSVLSLTHNYCFVPQELTFAVSLSLSMNSLFYHGAVTQSSSDETWEGCFKKWYENSELFHFKLMESIQTSKPFFFFFFLHFLRKFRMTHTFFFFFFFVKSLSLSL